MGPRVFGGSFEKNQWCPRQISQFRRHQSSWEKTCGPPGAPSILGRNSRIKHTHQDYTNRALNELANSGSQKLHE